MVRSRVTLLRRVAGLAAVLALVVPGLTAAGAVEPLVTDLVFTASDPVEVTFVVTETTKWDLHDARVDTAGRYGGVHLGYYGGVLRVPALGGSPLDRSGFMLGWPYESLPPGVYHATVLTEPGRPVVVRIPLQAGRAYVQDEVGPSAQWFHYEEKTLPAETDDAVHTHEIRHRYLASAGGDTKIMGQLAPTTVTSDIDLSVCAQREGSAECEGTTRLTVPGIQSGRFNAGTGFDTYRAAPYTAVGRVTYGVSAGAVLRLAVFHVANPYRRGTRH